MGMTMPHLLYKIKYFNSFHTFYFPYNNIVKECFVLIPTHLHFKECMSDSVTNYNYVGDTKICYRLKKTNANKCTLSEIFLTEIFKSFSAF